METKKGKGGAPRKTDAQRKANIVRVLFDDEEYSKLKARKATTDCPDLSKFVRLVCLEKPLRIKPQLTSYQSDLLSLLIEMRQDVLRIGVNINQATRRINGTTDYQDLRSEVGKMSSDVEQMEKQLDAVFTALKTNAEQHGSPN